MSAEAVKTTKGSKTPEPKDPKDPKDAKEAKEAEEDEDDGYIGYFVRPHVISRFYYGENNEAQLTEFDGAGACEGSVFVEGLAGIGISSTVVSAYLISQLKLPLVATFFSPAMPGMCSIHSYNATSPIRIYGNKDVCVAVGDYEIQPTQQSKLIYSMTQSFLDFARRHKCREVVSIDGYPVKGDAGRKIEKIAKMLPQEKKGLQLGPVDDDEDESKGKVGKKGKKGKKNKEDDEKKIKKKKRGPFETIGFLTSDAEIGVKLKELGHKPIKTGQITGVTGALLTLGFMAPADDPPLTVLLAPDPVQIPDQRGALLALSILRDEFGIAVDVTELQTEADRLQQKIRSTIDQIQQQVQGSVKRNQTAPPGMYI